MDIFDQPEEIALREQLFSTPGHHAYAIVDGAAAPGLLQRLNNTPIDYRCLFRGELDPALADAAPYLVRLQQYTPITEWLLTARDGDLGIFALLPESLDFNTVHRHFRRFLRVSGPDNQVLYFRYYDPRVMHAYLPTCTPEQAAIVFGPVKYYLLEDPEEHTQLYWASDQGVEQTSLIPEPAP